MGYCLNRLDELVFIAVSKPLLSEFGVHHRLECCAHDIYNFSIDFFLLDALKDHDKIDLAMYRPIFYPRSK